MAVTQILHGFGCRLLAHDPQENGECISLGVEYVALEKLYAERTSSRCIALESSNTSFNQQGGDQPNETRRDADQYQSWRSY
jgi:hypothetical protein